ncbi:hypothetical protein E0L36_25140 [Streptomyces sp. AJS327]|uniref:hypothetical protein n=1 Tax=Streptomyces sp. AJS327 TaxID=2545265 RepID=UPI0015DEAABD|nr:hypothetical protein [Streptomyces sp. AJS327]MBA0054015.1 hypothetical protein [Streptomyces sp. AJS327]
MGGREHRGPVRLLALDNENLDVDEPAHGEGHEAYVAWLDRPLGLTPTEDVDALLASQWDLGEWFDAWAAPFLERDGGRR